MGPGKRLLTTCLADNLEHVWIVPVTGPEDLIMTRERPEPHNPATNPERENAQGEHAGVSHEPEEFDTQNPKKMKQDAQKTKPAVPGGRKPDTAMCEHEDRPGIVDKSEDC